VKITELYLALIEREGEANRHALERVPEGKNDWKPHEKSMELGYLAALVAVMPAWLAMMIESDSYDLADKDPRFQPEKHASTQALLATADRSLALAKQALRNASDESLMKGWELKWSGQKLSEDPRWMAIANGALTHMAHHRGQLTVYLRLLGAKVPAIYGPSADERPGA